jgi:hypothetical protein
MSLSRKQLEKRVNSFWPGTINGDHKLEFRFCYYRPALLFFYGWRYTLYDHNPEWLKEHYPETYRKLAFGIPSM